MIIYYQGRWDQNLQRESNLCNWVDNKPLHLDKEINVNLALDVGQLPRHHKACPTQGEGCVDAAFSKWPAAKWEAWLMGSCRRRRYSTPGLRHDPSRRRQSCLAGIKIQEPEHPGKGRLVKRPSCHPRLHLSFPSFHCHTARGGIRYHQRRPAQPAPQLRTLQPTALSFVWV